jgi:hypothetical protein
MTYHPDYVSTEAAMPRGPAPGWLRRKEPITDDYILAAVNQVGGLGKHDADGHYATLVIKGLADRDEALEYQRSLYRCALFLHRRRGIPVSISVKISRDGKAWKITYTVHDKTHATKYHLTAHGADRTKWAYDVRRRGN